MNKHELQHQIRRHETADTLAANNWISKLGMDTDAFGTTHIKLLQAQQQAHVLLTHHSDLLSKSQRGTLEHFQQQMATKRTRNRLKPQAANPVLNISTKINRQLFKQQRQLTQA